MIQNETFLREYRIAVIGKINPQNTRKLELDVKNIPEFSESALLVSTQGGSLVDIQRMNSIITRAHVKFHGVGGMMVYSAGIAILLSCDTQAAFRNTKFRHHRVCHPDGLKVSNDEYYKVERELFAFIALRTGRSLKEVYDLADKNRILSAEEAKEFGFIKEIINADFSTETFRRFIK